MDHIGTVCPDGSRRGALLAPLARQMPTEEAHRERSL